MNIIIAGCGKVGQKLAECLSNEDDQNITVIDLKDYADKFTPNHKKKIE